MKKIAVPVLWGLIVILALILGLIIINLNAENKTLRISLGHLQGDYYQCGHHYDSVWNQLVIFRAKYEQVQYELQKQQLSGSPSLSFTDYNNSDDAYYAFGRIIYRRKDKRELGGGYISQSVSGVFPMPDTSDNSILKAKVMVEQEANLGSDCYASEPDIYYFKTKAEAFAAQHKMNSQ